MFLKANLDKVLMSGKGPFFHWFPRAEFPSALPFSPPSMHWGGSVLALHTAGVNSVLGQL